MVRSLFILAALQILLTNCETDVDIVAPEKDVPVMYAIFNQQDDTHFVKVNRLLQGSESFDNLAQNRGLAEYENLTIRLTKNESFVDGRGEVTHNLVEVVDEFRPVEVNDKEAGDFYYPEQTVYYSTAELDPSFTYGIEFETPEGTFVEGFTTLIPVAAFDLFGSQERLWRNNGFEFAQSNFVPDQFTLRVNQPVRAKAFQTNLFVRYKDISVNDNGNPYFSAVHELELSLGKNTYSSVRESAVRPPGQAEVVFAPRRIYELVAENVPDIDQSPGVVERVLDTARVEVMFISQDLHLYSEVARPSESLLEDKPSFTNFNTGVGVIGSRSKYVFEASMTRSSYEELKSAQLLGLTGSKGFCNPREPNDCLLQ